MSSDPAPDIDEVFMDSCREVSMAPRHESPVSPTSTIVSTSSPGYESAKLGPDEGKEAVVSDGERLSAFYANAPYDFYGTPSGALCVYKNGDAWPVQTGPEAYRIVREARGVHGHPMQATWRELGHRIYTLLDDKKVLWTSIDAVAFAEAGNTKFCPLLIWIGVEPASLAYELANTAAEAISFFLTTAGFSGFEIGFRESIVTRSATGPKMLSFNSLDVSGPEFRKPFTPILGLSIAPLKTPYFEGTGALYFRESKESKSVFLLTCAHVARPVPAHPNTGLGRKTRSHPRGHVIVLGSLGYTDVLKSMMRGISNQDDSIKIWQKSLVKLGEPQEGEPEEHATKRNEFLGLAKKAIERMGELDAFHSVTIKQWSVPEQRIIGEVLHVEPIDVNVAPHGFTKDWALIKLDDDKFDWATFMGNKIYVGSVLSPWEYTKLMFPRREDRANFEYPEDGLLQAFGVVQADEIRNPKQLDKNGEQCLFVVKNGRSSGTTFGRVTGMESFTRRYNKYGIEETSMEIAVLPYGNTEGAFSKNGDSGSIVLDRNGRIVGMITGGAGANDRTDITYLTPYWYIDEEIKKYFPNAYLYDVVE